MDYKNPIYNKWISVLLIPRSLILLFVYYFTTMTAIQYYSLEEISKNNGKINSKIWIVIKNNVYDITNYMDKVCNKINKYTVKTTYFHYFSITIL